MLKNYNCFVKILLISWRLFPHPVTVMAAIHFSKHFENSPQMIIRHTNHSPP